MKKIKKVLNNGKDILLFVLIFQKEMGYSSKVIYLQCIQIAFSFWLESVIKANVKKEKLLVWTRK